MNLAAAPVFTAPVVVVDPSRLAGKVSELFPYALSAALCVLAVAMAFIDRDAGFVLADLAGYLG